MDIPRTPRKPDKSQIKRVEGTLDQVQSTLEQLQLDDITITKDSAITLPEKELENLFFKYPDEPGLLFGDQKEEPCKKCKNVNTDDSKEEYSEDISLTIADICPSFTHSAQKSRKREKRKSPILIEQDFIDSPLQLNEYQAAQFSQNPRNIRIPRCAHLKKSIDEEKKLLRSYGIFIADDKKGASKKKSCSKKKYVPEEFEEYLSAAEVKDGLEDKTMVAGPIRINKRNYKEAYLSEGDEKDIIIEGLKNRNRALEGDEVVVFLNPPSAWKPNGQRTGKVVHILEEFHSRICVGKVPLVIDLDNVMFLPRDPRVPRIKINLGSSSIYKNYFKLPPSIYSKTLFYAKITAWTDVKFAYGYIIKKLGKCGDVEAETTAIMLENNFDPDPLAPMFDLFYPFLPYTVPKEEISKRLDLRKNCIFTIDPATARDLDDAVSVTRLDNGNLEVGVHISDVSFFLECNKLLDDTVCRRATTVYLVQEVYHMLPEDMCKLCSLTPLEDKLAFSVFVEFSPDANVVSHRFARTVINSCTKLAYEHAQMVIDNPEKKFASEDFPEIGNGFNVEDCVATIKDLYTLSVVLRKRRFDSGALRIDQPKLCFNLDPDTQAPTGYFIYENNESHRLIEEFMLLANMTVAKHIHTTYPDLAFLRRHRPPKKQMMLDLKTMLENCGIHLDISDAGTIHSSILKFSERLEGEPPLLSWARLTVLNNLCAKPMLRAEYFCPSEIDPELHHFALNAPCYTHFTSPIRRYADVMVHRLLAASLGLETLPPWTPLNIRRIARICNQQKYAAKLAGEQSSLLFLAVFLTEPVISDAAVIDVKDRSIDVVVKRFGIVLRSYTDPLQAEVVFTKNNGMQQLQIHWKEQKIDQFIQIFSVVSVIVSRVDEKLKLRATLLPPTP